MTPQYPTRIAGNQARIDLAIVRHDKRLAIELDGHAYHASEPARSADAARDLALTKAGWIPVRFTGADADINIETAHQEFSKWQWIDAQQLPQLIVPFKKRLYENILAEFAELI